jgi:hypothetical protein
VDGRGYTQLGLSETTQQDSPFSASKGVISSSRLNKFGHLLGLRKNFMDSFSADGDLETMIQGLLKVQRNNELEERLRDAILGRRLEELDHLTNKFDESAERS